MITCLKQSNTLLTMLSKSINTVSQATSANNKEEDKSEI